ncbi:hypothetical protein BDK51DRAFT_41036 [Blyttiomyces helicus]|uniref:Uncharacterized protein n=1 Tax=Blyttiomyces helicus TaxID=388810 RepID=A0A4P9WC42_9FUNG|nr:hypothetical protein BDK51DRAFT_41036 [Blyttiomyces helicus]|eukprot:RKO89872.1 hypothetical protein BDK51DRAFT_41036 [Blyttiomyces helicus]
MSSTNFAIGGAAVATATAVYLNSPLLLTTLAVPALTLLHILVSRLAPTPPSCLATPLPPRSLDTRPNPAPPRPHKLYLVRTTHARLHPVHHAFAYPLFYFGLNLDALAANCGPLSAFARALHVWAHNGWGIFSTRDEDFLAGFASDPGFAVGSIRGKLATLLRSVGIDPAEFGECELIATPRLFGYAFNPLSVYYCFQPEVDGVPSGVRAVVLEVSNTFGEKHVYICDVRNRVEPGRKNYHSSYRVERAFHVSPFNNRSGDYECHVSNVDDGRLDILLIIQKYVDHVGEKRVSSCAASVEPTRELDPDTEIPRLDASEIADSFEEPKGGAPSRFIARVYGDAFPLNGATIGYLLFVYPVTAFLTFPRILFQAWKLAYSRGLPIYQRPNPFRKKDESGGTILKKAMNPFQRYCMTAVVEYLSAQCLLHGGFIAIHLPETNSPPISIPSADTKFRSQCPRHDIHVLTPAFFARLALDGDDLGRALSTSFVRGDWTCPASSLEPLLNIFLASPRQPDAPPASTSPTPARLRPQDRTFPHHLARAVRRVHNGDDLTTPAPASQSPFRSHAFATLDDRVAPTWMGVLAMYRGSLAMRTEEAFFAGVAEFAWNPYGVVERVAEYAKEMGDRDAAPRETDASASVGEMVGELGDSVDPRQREVARFRAFLEAYRTVVGDTR